MRLRTPATPHNRAVFRPSGERIEDDDCRSGGQVRTPAIPGEMVPGTIEEEVDSPPRNDSATASARCGAKASAPSPVSVLKPLFDQQCGRGGRIDRSVRSAYTDRAFSRLRERIVDLDATRDLDKVFASAWLDQYEVVVGTKCNTLLKIDVTSGRRTQIDLPRFSGRSARGQTSSCGIHSIAANDAMLASGGWNPCDLSVFELATLQPLQTFSGHKDWIFDAAWLKRDRILTASRDGTIKCWRVDPSQGPQVEEPSHTHAFHKGKVRALKINARGVAASVDTDGKLLAWDPHSGRVVEERHLSEHRRSEIACLAVSDNLFAVGSQSHVALLDLRCAGLRYVTSVDPGSGIRSLNFQGSVISVGAGRGGLSLFDLRRQRFVDVAQGKEGSTPFLQSSCTFHEESQNPSEM